jgi:hypothetical protein
MPEYPKILAVREGSGRTSVWNEYLCLNPIGPDKAALQVCRYEALAEYERPEDDEHEISLPAEIDGKKVVGVEDGYIVGGELACYDDWEIVYGVDEIDDVAKRIKDLFDVDDGIIEELKMAVSSTERRVQNRPPLDGKPEWMSEDAWQDQLEEVRAWQKHRQRQRGGPEPESH